MKVFRPRPGATLVELIVTIAILGVVAAGLVRMMSSQSRFFADHEGQVNARRVARSPFTLMISDIRMTDADSGLVAAAADSFTIRVPYRIGISCGAAAGATTLALQPIDSLALVTASLAGHGWIDSGGAGHYVAGGAVAAGTGATCFAAGIDTFPQTGLVKTIAPSLASAPAGTPVFLYQEVTYSIRTSVIYPFTKGLFRRIGSGAAEEITAPLTATSTFLYYPGGGGPATPTPTLGTTILGVDLDLVGQNLRDVTNGKTQTAPVETAIYFKNR
jgi:type II secretory pathway pseudopilin PulG